MEIITLVNEENEITGYEEKLTVHRQGLLHQAFSILIYNSSGEMLIQRRAMEKYHSAGLWTNACCGHPKKGEEISKAAKRRLKEEMGFECDLDLKFIFHYKVNFENDLIENEMDHVYRGEYNGKINGNPEEIMDYKWVSLEWVKKDALEVNPENYTYWFKEILVTI